MFVNFSKSYYEKNYILEKENQNTPLLCEVPFLRKRVIDNFNNFTFHVPIF